LDDLALVLEGCLTHGALLERDVEDAIDLVGRGHGSEVSLVPLATSGLLGMLDGVFATKRISLAVVGALVVSELLTELVEFGFEFSDAAVAFAAASAGTTSGSHDDSLDSGSGECRTGKA
jgi:hypothetical protein